MLTIKACLRRQLGVQLPRGYLLHHIDHNRRNNDLRNLLLMTPKEHRHLHLETAEQPALKTRHAALRWLERIRRNPRHLTTAQIVRCTTRTPSLWLTCHQCHQTIGYNELRLFVNDPLNGNRRTIWHPQCWEAVLR